MQVVGNTLYTTHYEWIDAPGRRSNGWVSVLPRRASTCRDRAHPRIGAQDQRARPARRRRRDRSEHPLHDRLPLGQRHIAGNDFDVLRIDGDDRDAPVAHDDRRLGRLDLRPRHDGVPVRRSSTCRTPAATPRRSVDLHAIDLSDPVAPASTAIASDAAAGAGCSPSRATARSSPRAGGRTGIDVYQLRDGQAPLFEQIVAHARLVGRTACRARTTRCSCRAATGACRRSSCNSAPPSGSRSAARRSCGRPAAPHAARSWVASAIGSVMKNVVPLPSSVSNVRVPLCFPTMTDRAMERPWPVPLPTSLVV